MNDVAEGRDPRDARRTAKEKAAAAQRDTLQAICTEYQKREGCKLRTAKERERMLRTLVYPVLGARQVSTIGRRELTRVLDTIADERGERTADMTLALLSRIFNWHATRSDDFISPVVRGMARATPADRARSRVLSDDELRKVWCAAGDGGVFGALIKFLLLTSARKNEAARMTWDEIVGTDWILPPSRNKTGQELVRPLPATALAVLGALPRVAGCPYVFHTDGVHAISAFSRFKRNFDAVCGVRGWVIHDTRRTSRSLLSRAGINSDHAERVLGHVIAGVRATYDRHEFHAEKKAALEALAAQIDRIIDPPAGNVVALRS
jgi:integrase